MSWCDKVLKDSARYWERYEYPTSGTVVISGGFSVKTMDEVNTLTASTATLFGNLTANRSGSGGFSDGTVGIRGWVLTMKPLPFQTKQTRLHGEEHPPVENMEH